MKNIVFLLTIILSLSSLKGQAQNASGAKFKFAEESHDFGKLKEGDDAACVFEFMNVGKEPLIITNCTAQCGCTIPTWDKQPILPGGKGKINVKYDTHGKNGSFLKEVYIQSNAVLANPNQERYTIKIQGSVTPK